MSVTARRLWLTVVILTIVCEPPKGVAQSYQVEVERAATRFRIQNYRTFRHDRPEYLRRIRVAIDLVDRWHARGASPLEARDLTDWFQRATSALQSGYLRLPPPPRISDIRATRNSTFGVRLEAMPDLPQRHRREVATNRRAEYRGAASPRARVAMADPQSAAPVLSPAANESNSNARRWPARLARQRTVTSTLSRRPAPSVSWEDSVPSDRGQDDRITSPAWPSELHVPAAVGQSVEFSATDEPTNAPGSFRSGEGQASIVARPPIDIDLAALRARVRGVNLALKSTQDELSNSSATTALRLVEAFRELDALRIDRDFCQLYIDLLTPEDIASLPTWEPLAPICELLRQRVLEARITMERKATNELSGKQKQIRDKLDAITERLDTWTQTKTR